jgi:ketosteroid isomerase-like protein
MAITQTPDEFMQAYERAMNARDLETASSMIDEDAIFLFSNETIHKGRPAILKAIQNNFDSIQDEIFKFINLTWFIKSDELSACIYDFTWSGKIDGKPAAGYGRGTSILKRVGMKWVIIQEHLSRGKFTD